MSAEHIAEMDALVGSLRGTVADAVEFARECAEAWGGVRVMARVDRPRTELPALTGRYAANDGPTWNIRVTPPEATPPCTTCGPTATEQHPRRPGVTRCANCKEWLRVAPLDADKEGDR